MSDPTPTIDDIRKSIELLVAQNIEAGLKKALETKDFNAAFVGQALNFLNKKDIGSNERASIADVIAKFRGQDVPPLDTEGDDDATR